MYTTSFLKLSVEKEGQLGVLSPGLSDTGSTLIRITLVDIKTISTQFIVLCHSKTIQLNQRPRPFIMIEFFFFYNWTKNYTYRSKN